MDDKKRNDSEACPAGQEGVSPGELQASWLRRKEAGHPADCPHCAKLQEGVLTGSGSEEDPWVIRVD